MDGYTRAGLEVNRKDMLPLTSAKLYMVDMGSEIVGKQWNHGSDGSQVSSFGKALPVFKKKTHLLSSLCQLSLRSALWVRE